MSYFYRIRNIIFGVLMLAMGLLLILSPEGSIMLVASLLNIALYFYGGQQLWFYFRMARHMVGGKTILYRSIIILDAALFMTSAIVISNYIVTIYLLILYAFTGFVSILRALESKANGAPNWRFKLATGIISVLFAISLLVVGLIMGNSNYLSIGFGITLVYLAAVRIITAFKKTAIVYIQ